MQKPNRRTLNLLKVFSPVNLSKANIVRSDNLNNFFFSQLKTRKKKKPRKKVELVLYEETIESGLKFQSLLMMSL